MKATTSLSRLAAVAVLALSAISVDVVATTPALAVRKCPAADAKSINDFIAAAAQSDLSETETEKRLTARWCSLTKISTDTDPDFTTMEAGPEDITWYNMSMYWDHDVQRYVATATWKWNRNGFLDDDFVVCASNQIGNKNGVGIRFSGGGMNILGKAASAWGNPAENNYDDDYGVMNVPYSRVSDSGVGFIAQDYARRLRLGGVCIQGEYDFNMWGGTVTLTFKNLNGCRNVQMYPVYIHTWDSTGVTSLGAGPWSFSIGWTSQGDEAIKEEGGPSANICA